jgi:signal transduction histidine kinase
LDASSLLATLYKTKGNLDSAFYYQQAASATKDSLFGLDKFHKLQLLTLSEQQRVQQLREQQALSKTRVQMVGLLSSVVVFLLIAFIFWRSNRQQKKANLILNEKNLQIEKQSESLKKTLDELKSTQAQLIQSEKMASLGELTAGIAHEIQNPLNFVNNFSEVNTELVEELQAARSRLQAERNEALEDGIINDIKQNLEKINHHGKRADAIVKGMLQHSRTSSGARELTDINRLTDEYVRLAYHGLRAKDKTFNAEIRTDFDYSLSAGQAGIGKINVIPQDIGRVILNLINNAFYSVNEKSRQNIPGYEPAVVVATKKIKSRIEISVKDNGNGMPQNILGKIFQPFFTTKPTGQGTGLGLSLSYDIVKAHGGEVKMETREGEGSEFTIKLPIA